MSGIIATTSVISGLRMNSPLFDPVLGNDRFQRHRVSIAPESVTISPTCGAESLQDAAIAIPETWRNAAGAVVAMETGKDGVSRQKVTFEPTLDSNLAFGIMLWDCGSGATC